MKQLFIIRHAHAALADAGMDDHARELTPMGESEAHEMGIWMEQQQICPDRVLVSSATRAMQTAKLIVSHCQCDQGSIVVDDEIYNADYDTLLEKLHTISDDHTLIFMVGHNPGMHELANYLSDERITDLSPCDVVQLSFHVTRWQDIKAKSGHLITHTGPGD